METSGLILALNSGSSSLKFGVFRRGADDEEPVLTGSADGIGRADGKLTLQSASGELLLQQDHLLESQEEALAKLAASLREHLHQAPVAVGHRIVHGGPHLRTHQRITPRVLEQLKAARHLAPLHIPPALELLAQAQHIFSDCPHFACFDTAFHRTLPEVAQRLPLPRRYFEAGLLRYGFHGLSYESLVHRLGKDLPSRAIFAHLGNGSSLAAVHNGVSIDTTMGLTPTGGAVMGTRPGDLDPGLVLYLLRQQQGDRTQALNAVEHILNYKSGISALSGLPNDMRSTRKAAAEGNTGAQLAIEVFTRSVRKSIGSFAFLLGGLDAIVFTGGIGEHDAKSRAEIVAGLQPLGISLDVKLNDAEKSARQAQLWRISASDSHTEIFLIPAKEDWMIARHVQSMLGDS